VISSILLSSKAAFFQATFAIAIISAVAILETTGQLSHYHPNGFIDQDVCLLNTRFTTGMLLVLGSTFYIIVYLTTSIANKLRKGERSLLIATEKLAHSDKLKSQYVRKVSHDIQSSLSTIQTCVTVVLNGTTGPIPEKSKSMLQRAENRSGALIKFVKDLLNLSSIRAHGTMDKKILSLTNTILHLADNTRILADQKQQTLEVDIHKHFWVEVNAHALEELITNLISNAIRYTPEGGQITIRASKKSDEMIQVAVSDTGIGIPKEDQKGIFEDFFRAKNAKTFTRNGTGLGLSIAKQIVESHGGKIWFKSKSGQGTTFYFTLPEAVLHEDEEIVEAGSLGSIH
jgi:signal transduction histidine kinase